MRATVSMAWMLLRGGGRRDLGTQVLAGAAFAVSTCLLLLTLGVNLGFAQRSEREAWMTPVAAQNVSQARAVQATSRDFYSGRPITVVALARVPGAPGRPPVPPGLAAFPAPGQTWFSPALAELVESDPGALKQRWPGTSAGTITAAGLTTPGELMVVIGAAPGSPLLRAPIVRDLLHPQFTAGPTPIAGFASQPGPEADRTYRDLSLIASVLLIVPLLVLGGAAARLGLARRDHRLATVRLVGGSSSQILTMVAIESALTALLGALVGVLLYAGLIPLLARVPFGGGAWFRSDLWVGTGVLTAVLVGVVLGGVVSAVTTLRRVVVTPLGVTQRHGRRDRHVWRVLLFFAALVGYLALSRSSNPSLTSMVVAFGIVFLTLNLLGPWVMAVLGRAMVAGAQSPARLLAGRRILDEPKAAWRIVAGLALTGFIAGFLALFPTSTGQVVWGDANVINVAIPAEHAARDRVAAQKSLRASGLSQNVRSGSNSGALFLTMVGTRPRAEGTRYLSIAVDPENRERTRSALHQALPGLPAATGTDIGIQEDEFSADIHRASTAVLIASFLIAIASAGITACAGVLDRRRTFQLLHLAGMPIRLLNEARRRETTAPVLILVGGSLATGLACSAPLTKLGLGGSGQLDARSLAVLVITVVAGLVGVRLASAASAPLLRSVATDLSSRPD